MIYIIFTFIKYYYFIYIYRLCSRTSNISKNNLNFRFIRYGSGAFLCYILNIILIPIFGIYGSILATEALIHIYIYSVIVLLKMVDLF